MKIVVAPNTMKGSLDAFEVAHAIARGLQRALPDADIMRVPIADGGDGTMRVLVEGTGGRVFRAPTVDALGRPITAEWGLLGDGVTGVIDAASASGLVLIETKARDPMAATSYGTGVLVRAALDFGCRRLIVGVGGTATVDAGMGLLEALGARGIGLDGSPIPRGGGGLARLERLDLTGCDARLGQTEIVVACDVDNPLLGDEGAAPVFAPQKGATATMVAALEKNLERFAHVVQRGIGHDVGAMRHGGAAGGMAAGIFACLGGRLAGGAELVLERLDLGERLAQADLVVTAEGRLDRQTLFNKGPYAVACAAKRQGIAVIAFAGELAVDPACAEFSVFDAAIGICSRPMRSSEAMAEARSLLEQAAANVGSVLRLGSTFRTSSA